MDVARRRRRLLVELERINISIFCFLALVAHYILTRHCSHRGSPPRRPNRRYSIHSRIPRQLANLSSIISDNDIACLNNTRMSRNAFGRLCEILSCSGGLNSSNHVTVCEQVAMFLCIVSHHKKNRIISHNFTRSGRTISKYFRDVLHAIIRVYHIFICTPQPVGEECTSERWKHFKGCLGALDGTYIPIRVPAADKPRYRNRKGEVSVNVLGVCDRDMRFTYILAGWEGSAADSRVLRDAISRSNGLQVPRGTYYLCDNGYANSEGFLTPYKGVRYHLNEWASGCLAPRNKEEFFNMKHARARSVIERAFGVMKNRWAILRSPSWYPVRLHNRIIMACCLLHNYIMMEMGSNVVDVEGYDIASQDELWLGDCVDSIGASAEWSHWRDDLAMKMYSDWMSGSR